MDKVLLCSRLGKDFRRLAAELQNIKHFSEFTVVVAGLGQCLRALREACVHGKCTSKHSELETEEHAALQNIAADVREACTLLQNSDTDAAKDVWRCSTDNVTAVVSSLLEAYAVVCTRMTPDQHTSFVNLLTQTPSIATLLALSSHLSMVAPLAPKRGWVRGEPGGPSGAPSNLSSSFPDEYDGLPRGSEPSLVNNRDAEGQMPITEVIVQPISAEFVARILAMRVQPGSTNPMQLLPEHLQGQDAASTKEPAMDAQEASGSLFRHGDSDTQPRSSETNLEQDKRESVLCGTVNSGSDNAVLCTTPLLVQLVSEAALLATARPLVRNKPLSISAEVPENPGEAPDGSEGREKLESELRKLCTALLAIPDKLASVCCPCPGPLRPRNLLPQLLSSVLQHTRSYTTANARTALKDAVGAAHEDAVSTGGSAKELLLPMHVQTAVAALLTSATLRGHADIFARWIHQASTHQLAQSHAPDYPSRVHVSPGGLHYQQEVDEKFKTMHETHASHACIAVSGALGEVTEPSVHERLMRALLEASIQKLETRKASSWSLVDMHVSQRIIATLWLRGISQALPKVQHVGFWVKQISLKGTCLPPAAVLQLLMVLSRIDQESYSADRQDHIVHHTATESAALSGQALDLKSNTLLFSAGRDILPMHANMHEQHARMLTQFACAVAAAWAASSPSRGSEPVAAESDDEARAQRAQWAQQAKERAPHVQAAQTFVLLICMAALGGRAVDMHAELLSSILLGVSRRLQSGLTDAAAQRQGKRIARAFSQMVVQLHASRKQDKTPNGESQDTAASEPGLDGGFMPVEDPGVLYEEEDLSLLPEEVWWTISEAQRTQNKDTGGKTTNRSLISASANQDTPAADNTALTDSDDSDAESDASLDALSDACEEEVRAIDLDKKWRPVQLHTVAKAIRDNTKTVPQVEALNKLEALVRASPLPEVAKAAPELLRTLIYCNPPEWASNQHAPTATMHPDKRRLGTLAAIMALSPAAAPEAAISHMFSEHVDVSQRLLVLDSLCAAAHELAGRPLMQPLNAPGLGASIEEGKKADKPLLQGKYNPEKTRVWGSATLRKLQDGPEAPASINKFGSVALEWTVALLNGCAQQSAGSEVFRAEPAVFGRFLTTLGAFCSCSRLTMAADTLCSAILQVILDAPVATHTNKFVRKSALIATAELLRALPPPTVAGAMLRESTSQADSQMTQRLQDLQSHLRQLYESSADSSIRALAGGCLSLQSQLAEAALESIEVDTHSYAPAIQSQPNIILPPW